MTLKCLTSTKGGAGGATTTVSTLPQLSAAASAEGARVIVVQGAISGAAKVQVTSDKTIVGKAGSCMSIQHLSSTCGDDRVDACANISQPSRALALPSMAKRM